MTSSAMWWFKWNKICKPAKHQFRRQPAPNTVHLDPLLVRIATDQTLLIWSLEQLPESTELFLPFLQVYDALQFGETG